MKKLKGIAASDGIATAKAYMLVQPDLSFETTSIEDPEAEIARLDAAVAASKLELEGIKKKASENLGEEEAQVFEAHLTILSDPELFGQINAKITGEKVNAEAALKDVTDMFIGMFEAMEDNPYMQERASDIRDVTKRVMAHLLGVKIPNPALIDQEVVIIAHDLTPSDTAQLDRRFVKGFITDIGGRTSHSAIMSRTLEIPAIVGSGSATADIEDGQTIIIDGINGEAIIEPTEEQITEYQAKAAEFAALKAEWDLLKEAQTLTLDGKEFILGANIGTPKDVVGANDNGAEAVGLFRSEFLYMDASELPTEEEQFAAYKEAIEGMEGKQVVVRTMDIGGDKDLPYLPLPAEENPFLGFRAVRISLERQDIFRTQLRALLRASVYGRLAVMFPMIATVQEFKDAKAVFEEEKAKLVAEGIAVSDDIEVGMMMEVPAAAMIADKLAKYADFFSIGTNDLIQYTMAADRGNERVSYLYQPYNPSILRLVKNIIDASHAEGKWTGMCGEMAGDQLAVPLLVGLGLDEFSMSATSILKTRSLMKRLDTKKMEELAQKAVNDCETAEEVLALVEEYTK
ncbi:phosphoenolpyruvate-protein phosphotransferase [Ligilactobacillus ceti DSM 22408]|uniref:Phosphoenolpyruvate-protein phosphotransferase n=2 Tax=Ligilactobacillus TaxID=2767887 RepID=A0A0R2KLU7_9LACO|nr:phosphoenolpyruvate-protein phosphotransferase [Ligilactobacillus ceti DSM 22408]